MVNRNETNIGVSVDSDFSIIQYFVPKEWTKENYNNILKNIKLYHHCISIELL